MRNTLLYISRAWVVLLAASASLNGMSQVRMDKLEADKLIFEMLTQTSVEAPEELDVPLEICPDSLEETSEKEIYKVRGRTYDYPVISQSFFVQKSKKGFSPLKGSQWPVETLQNMLTRHLPATLRLNLSHHQYGGNVQTAEVPLSAFFQIFSGQMDFYACINEATRENIHAFLVMRHPGMNYIHMLRLDITPDALSEKNPTAKADLYTNIPHDNIKKLFDE